MPTRVRFRPPADAITMDELARLAGVSKATVSRALANNPLIADATRRRVQALAAQRGYRVNQAARALRARVTRTIGVTIFLDQDPRHSIADPFYLMMLGAIAEALSEHHHNLVLSKVSSRSQSWLEQTLRAHLVDGFIFLGQSVQHAVLNEAADRGAPMVVWGALLPDARYAVVGSHGEEGGFQAASHLVAQGCRDIAFLGSTRTPEIRQRFAGYRRALEAHGLTRAHQHQRAVHFDGESAYAEVSRILDTGGRIDGIVAASDVIAMSAIRALADRGKRVPDDVAVTGFDDIPLAAHTTPPLTTIRQDVPRAGRLLVQKLMERIGGRPAVSTQLPVQLIVRESSRRSR